MRDIYAAFVVLMWKRSLTAIYELLHAQPEKHIRCNPTLAQFIVADDFPPVEVEVDFAKENLDQDHVATREDLVTRGWHRLKELKALGEVSILEFPLPEVIEALQQKKS